MALKQDYILRMIEELINVLVKTLKDESKDDSISENDTLNGNELFIHLKSLVDNGKINEAENYLFEKINENNKKDFFRRNGRFI